MQGIVVGEILVLENQKEYICIRKISDGQNNYVFLVSNFKPLEIKIARETVEGDTLKVTFIGDRKEKQRLISLFQQDAKQEVETAT